MKYLTTPEVKALSESLHTGQKTKSGKNYFGHVLRVSEMAGHMYLRDYAVEKNYYSISTYQHIRQAGFLHDTLEDCVGCTSQTLLDAMVHPFVIGAVECLTRGPGVSYNTTLNMCKGNEIARYVKMADLDHNSRLHRIVGPPTETTEKTLERHMKYARAFLYLRDKK